MPTKPLKELRDKIAQSLRLRVLLLVIGAFVMVGIPAFLSFQWIVGETALKLGTLFAERQILYDRHRGLGALNREVALAETLARSPAVLVWAHDEEHAAKKARGLAELEHFRGAFADGSYFFVMERSGNYYFNDREGTYTGNQLRYAVSPDNPRDGWYFATTATGPGCKLNVDHDDVLRVTKVWINCVVEDQGKVLGVVGTGIDLSVFIHTVVESDQRGVESMFVDRSGAIQANRDARRIDFHSLTKSVENRMTIFQMVDRASDRAVLESMMEAARGDDLPVSARFMKVEGRKMLVGVGYLDRLGWYNVTLMDVDAIIDRGLFLPIGLLLALVMSAIAALAVWLFRRSVLDRLSRAEQSIAAIEAGDRTSLLAVEGSDEIGRMARAINRMAEAVRTRREALEEAVRERTARLERIAYLDALTGLLNRRGGVEAYDSAARGGAERRSLTGLILIDIDHFKSFNDTNGHRSGDAIIAEVARRMLRHTRQGDFCVRWGGDEFMVVLPDCDMEQLQACARRLHSGISGGAIALPDDETASITVTMGCHLAASGETVDLAAHRADLALYRAKKAGRDCYVVHEPGSDVPRSVPVLVA